MEIKVFDLNGEDDGAILIKYRSKGLYKINNEAGNLRCRVLSLKDLTKNFTGTKKDDIAEMRI